MQQIYRRTPMLKCDFNKIPKQLYWNHTSAWMIPKEHLSQGTPLGGCFWIFQVYVIELKSFTIFAKNWILDVWLSSEYIFDCFYCVLQYVPFLENYLNILLVVTLLRYVKCVFLFIRIKLINLLQNLYFLAAWLFNNIEIMSHQR